MTALQQLLAEAFDQVQIVQHVPGGGASLTAELVLRELSVPRDVESLLLATSHKYFSEDGADYGLILTRTCNCLDFICYRQWRDCLIL